MHSAHTDTKGKMRATIAVGVSLEADERTSLLPRTQSSEDERPCSILSLPHIPQIQTLHDPRTILYTLVCLLFFSTLGGCIQVLPTTRIIEDVICHQYYDGVIGQGHIGMRERIDEDLCKTDRIQKELAFVKGIWDALDAVPSFFCAVPYGILADKIGRRPVFQLSMLGMMLSNAWGMSVMCWWKIFPLRLMFFSPILAMVGGGGPVFCAMLYAMIADISTEKTRALDFLFCGIGSLLASILAPTISAMLMKLSTPWHPMVVGFSSVLLSIFISFFLPETSHLRKLENAPNPSKSFAKNVQGKSLLSKATSFIRHMTAEAKETGSLMKSLPITLLSLTFFTHLFTSAAEGFSSVYVSKRFQWHLSDTSYLLSLVAFINIILLIIILPYLSYLLTSPHSPLPLKHRLATPRKDLLLDRLSILTMILGALLIAGPTIHFVILGLMIFALGHGFTHLVRSVITTLVDEQHVARLYSLISIFDTLGAVMAGPVLPWLFGIGLRWKGEGRGDAGLALPYVGTAVVCAGALAAVSAVRLDVGW